MTPLVLCTLTIIITLAVSGYAKVKDPSSTVTAIINLKLDQWLPLKPVARVLPWAELALAAALLFLPGLGQVLVAGATLVLFIGYWAVIARAVVQGNTASCNCFGSASSAPVSVYTLLRNTALLLAAVAALIGALQTRGSALTMLLALDSQGWLWVISAGTVALALWAIYRSELVPTTAHESTAAEGETWAEADYPVDEEGDYMRTPVPFAALHYPPSDTSDPKALGQQVTLRDLAMAQARVLLFVSPGCGHCHQVIVKVDDWQQQLPMLGIHPVVSQASDLKSFSFTGDIQAFIDPSFTTQRIFGSGTPAAVALGTDGMLAGGPVFGGDKVMRFLDDIIAEINADYQNHIEEEAPEQAREEDSV